jgi:hypothetical protein
MRSRPSRRQRPRPSPAVSCLKASNCLRRQSKAFAQCEVCSQSAIDRARVSAAYTRISTRCPERVRPPSLPYCQSPANAALLGKMWTTAGTCSPRLTYPGRTLIADRSPARGSQSSAVSSPRESFSIFHGSLGALGKNPLCANVYGCRRVEQTPHRLTIDHVVPVVGAPDDVGILQRPQGAWLAVGRSETSAPRARDPGRSWAVGS